MQFGCMDSRRHILGPLNYVADLPGRRPLRSAGTDCLAVRPVQLTTVANPRVFSVVGPRTWNDLPDDVTSAKSLCRLKTYVLMKSFY